MKPFALALAVWFGLDASARAEERYLLAADNQVIEIDRSGKVTDLLKHPGHGGIYDAARLPDGGIAYAHRGGLAVFDAEKKLVMEHKARAGEKGTEADSVAVLEGGKKFALMDSGVSQIRIVDRTGAVVSEAMSAVSNAGRLSVLSATICAVLKPATCAVVNASIIAVVKLAMPAVVMALTLAVVMAASCAVPSAASCSVDRFVTCVVASAAIWAVLRLST